MQPYVRESRRIRAEYTVTERSFHREQSGRQAAPQRFADAVAVGGYRIDVHEPHPAGQRATTGGNAISRSADQPVPAAGAGRLLDRAPSLVYHLLAIDSVAAILEAGMALVQIATRIDSRLKQAVEEVCSQRGLKIGRFVQDALLDKLEELEDIEDLKAIRFEPTKSWTDVLSDLELDGEV